MKATALCEAGACPAVVMLFSARMPGCRRTACHAVRLLRERLLGRLCASWMQKVPQSTQRYFQQLRPLSACDAEDGRIVGRMLKDLVESKPKNLAHAIRTFVNRTAMLRECSFCHIGAMLVRLLNADAQAGPDDDAAIAALSPSAVTEQQARAIGSAIALSVHRSESQAAALIQAVDLDPVLRTTKSQYLWFVPMLEILLVTPRRPSTAKRLSASVTPQATFYAPSSANFDSVVRCIP
jgi:hypothetical protein